MLPPCLPPSLPVPPDSPAWPCVAGSDAALRECGRRATIEGPSARKDYDLGKPAVDERLVIHPPFEGGVKVLREFRLLSGKATWRGASRRTTGQSRCRHRVQPHFKLESAPRSEANLPVFINMLGYFK
jgi:hypothetical protein